MTSLTVLLVLLVCSASVWSLPAGPSAPRNRPLEQDDTGAMDVGVAPAWLESYREQEPLAGPAGLDSMPKRAYFGSGFRYHLLFPHPIWNQKQAKARGGRSTA
ncbi:uncharacterized protein LOC118429523 [Branchiostoma floridae]|uniref:Uncharacterized protein LOC118429523 n=1 Tax=Branchiostoma floridae TaxID=7739 RepID=A0A9J7N9A7_BRAFL|nr:uncharacterized protein LOC118429523 [Branchiostoma floridae]